MSFVESLAPQRDALREFCERHRITELALFGSAVRGDLQADSDVDVLVTFGAGVRWDLFDFVQMRDELAELFGRSVDLVERGTIRNPYRRRSILRDATTVYAA